MKFIFYLIEVSLISLNLSLNSSILSNFYSIFLFNGLSIISILKFSLNNYYYNNIYNIN